MKISWGTGIVITFVIFISLLTWAVTASLKADHHLVTNDYYEQELDYGNRMEEIKNVTNLGAEFAIKQSTKGVEVLFPKHWKPESVKGNIQFYKPDNIKLDFNQAIAIKNGVQLIPIEKFKAGKWRVKVLFIKDGKTFYKEDVFFF